MVVSLSLFNFLCGKKETGFNSHFTLKYNVFTFHFENTVYLHLVTELLTDTTVHFVVKLEQTQQTVCYETNKILFLNNYY